MKKGINENKDNLRYIAYMRKSDEREERQILSLDAQKAKIKQQFADLNIIDWQPEQKKCLQAPRPPRV